jgi:hypothetical protein
MNALDSKRHLLAFCAIIGLFHRRRAQLAALYSQGGVAGG